jgi:hypothetical protein
MKLRTENLVMVALITLAAAAPAQLRVEITPNESRRADEVALFAGQTYEMSIAPLQSAATVFVLTYDGKAEAERLDESGEVALLTHLDAGQAFTTKVRFADLGTDMILYARTVALYVDGGVEIGPVVRITVHTVGNDNPQERRDDDPASDRMDDPRRDEEAKREDPEHEDPDRDPDQNG